MSKWKNSNWWVSPFNFDSAVESRHKVKSGLKLHDATLRDGEQTPGVVLRMEEKIEIAGRLDEAGVQRIEAGMPAVSEEDRRAIEKIKQTCKKAQIFSFVRAMDKDIQMSKECGADGVVIELPLGKPKLELQFKWDIQRIIDMSVKSIMKAKELGLYAVLFPYDTTRADEEDLEKLLNALNSSCRPDSIGLVDTMGCALPGTVSYLTRLIKSKIDIPLEIHTHNDFGLALATSLAAAESGAEVIHCCINGMGERTGNCALEEVVMALQLLYGLDVGIDLGKIVELSSILEKMTGFKMPANKPVVGLSNYTRESGIGADTVIREPLAMFAVHPSYLRKEPKIVLGKKSGLTSIEMKLKSLGVEVDEELKSSLVRDVKSLGIEKKGLVTDKEFLKIVNKYK